MSVLPWWEVVVINNRASIGAIFRFGPAGERNHWRVRWLGYYER